MGLIICFLVKVVDVEIIGCYGYVLWGVLLIVRYIEVWSKYLLIFEVKLGYFKLIILGIYCCRVILNEIGIGMI